MQAGSGEGLTDRGWLSCRTLVEVSAPVGSLRLSTSKAGNYKQAKSDPRKVLATAGGVPWWSRQSPLRTDSENVLEVRIQTSKLSQTSSSTSKATVFVFAKSSEKASKCPVLQF